MRDSVDPVSRAAPTMGDRQHLNPVRQLNVDHGVREPANEQLSNVWIRDAWDRSAVLWRYLDTSESSVEKSEEVEPESWPLLIVPISGMGNLGPCLSTDTEGTVQRFLRPCSSRWRTSGQGSPTSSPDRARAARSLISVAHSASASSSTSPSRLAISSAAISARSADPSLSASSRNLLAALVTGTRLARPESPNKPLERTGAMSGPTRERCSAGRSAPAR